MSLIADTLLTYLPSKRKQTPSGWISFNAPCCDDKRQRGGFILNGGDAVSYHCFNCGFKASWQPGRTISQKMNKLMRDLNMPDDVISQLRLEALRLNENSTATVRQVIPTFEVRALPPDTRPINNWLDEMPEKLLPVLEYIAERKMYLDYYDFQWTPKIGFSNRLIIPFYKDGVCVGYTARAINDAKPKYISEQQPGYVFNLDRQTHDRKYVIVTEGPIDAICVDGVAVMSAEIGPTQAPQISQLQREVIVLADRDDAGVKMVEQALELGWSVAFPEWKEGIKDVNDAVNRYGRLYTLFSIINSKESNNLKIQLRMRKWFKKEEE
jgi:hypothetical protein